MAEQYNMEADKIKEIVPSDDIVKDLAMNKAIDLIRDSAVITEKKATAKKASSKTA